MRSFLHVELAYDVAMRRYIPVNILFTSLTDHKILSGWMVYRQCFLWVGKKSIFKRMTQGALKF